MSKGQRPSRHLRKVHTKRGMRVVMVNPSIKRRNYGYSPSNGSPSYDPSLSLEAQGMKPLKMPSKKETKAKDKPIEFVILDENALGVRSKEDFLVDLDSKQREERAKHPSKFTADKPERFKSKEWTPDLIKAMIKQDEDMKALKLKFSLKEQMKAARKESDELAKETHKALMNDRRAQAEEKEKAIAGSKAFKLFQKVEKAREEIDSTRGMKKKAILSSRYNIKEELARANELANKSGNSKLIVRAGNLIEHFDSVARTPMIVNKKFKSYPTRLERNLEKAGTAMSNIPIQPRLSQSPDQLRKEISQYAAQAKKEATEEVGLTPLKRIRLERKFKGLKPLK